VWQTDQSYGDESGYKIFGGKCKVKSPVGKP
jgi:hypothetical protein